MPLPAPQVRGHFLHSLDLHNPISSPLRLYESSQNVTPVMAYTTLSGGQFCFFSWILMPEPFKHIGGYITLYICVSGHQIIQKSLQFPNQVRMDNSIICLMLPTIATPIHSTGTSIYSSIAAAPWSTPTVSSSASWPSAVLRWDHPKHLGRYSFVKTTIFQ